VGLRAGQLNRCELDFDCRHWLMPEDRMSCPQDDPSASLGRTCPGGDSTFCKGITLLRERV
jgi:hypothetical protein